jgi:hypothetical protein
MTTELQTTFSNVFEKRNFGTTQLNLDMEIWRTAITYQYGVSDQVDLKIELPFISNMGGFLDAFIQGYHQTLGVPNAGRDKVANGEFRFFLSQDGTTLVDDNNIAWGLSDTILRAKFMLPTTLNLPFTLALAPYMKLPTGKVTRGLSSGHVDFGGAVLLEKHLWRFHFVTQGGFVILTGHDRLESILRNAFFQFGQSVEFQLADGLSLITQLSGNTSTFKNVDTQLLKQSALDLNVGLAGAFPLRHTFLDEFYYHFSFSEDITGKGPSVDFSLSRCP